MSEPTAPGWAADMVETELRRAYPEYVGKAALEEALGIGPGELREVVAALEDDGVLKAGDTGFAWIPVDDRPIGQGALEAEDVPEPESDADPPGGDASPERVEGRETPPEAAQTVPGAESGHAGDTRYAAYLLLEVRYHPELQEGETDDEAAMREVTDLVTLAEEGITREHPDLPVDARVLKLEAYDNPRVVFKS